MQERNVTIHPDHKATAAHQLAIEEVRSYKSGRLISVRGFIERQSYGAFVRCRTLIKEGLHRGKPRLMCANCARPVYVVARPEKSFYFRHTIEDGSCPALTRSPYSAQQISAMKYLGARESEAHKRMKTRLVQSLEADPRFANIKAEKNWRAASNPSAYKRPDVQAQYGAVRIALEVQLSTTFLEVVVSRREFYRDEQAMLLWVLPRFNPDYRRLTDDDIFFPNNSNMLVVDDETLRLSQEQKAFHVRCWYWEPYLDGERLEHRWSERLCRFDELTLDVPGQRAFYFDVAGRRVELRRQQVEQRIALRKLAEDDVRQRFYDFCDAWNDAESFEQVESEWYELVDALAELGISIPQRPDGDGKFRSLALALLSVKLGRPVGFRFKKLVEVLHTIAERYKDLVWHVGWAVRVYDRAALIASEDRHGKWASRQKSIRAAMKAGAKEYQPYAQWGQALALLFPEMTQYFNGQRQADDGSTEAVVAAVRTEPSDLLNPA